ncbi:MAG TPA: branched-chain amino acid ABC transporter permease [Anaerolineae bacterium]|nr:branched-chain amino acid ABC transporter permease [Anaerolineae bacterium]
MATLKARLSTAPVWLIRHQRWALIAALAFACIYPYVVRLYFVTLAEDVLIFAIFAMSLDLLLGYTGLTSFGHAAFFGAGAYLLAYLTTRFGVTNLVITVPLVLLGTAMLAMLIGFFTLRTRGIYFLMVTLAFAQMLFSIAINWSAVTGGSDGLPGVPRPSIGIGPLSFTFDSRESFYYLILVCFLLTYWLLRRIVNSPLGWAFRGIRENEARMRALGYNTFRFKLASFAIGGAFAGLAGLLQAHSARIASPENLYWTMSGQVMIMVIVGGASTLSGPVLGAATVRLLRNFISSATPRWETLMGAIFILFVLFARRGIVGVLSDARKRFEAERPATAARPAEISESPQAEAE